MNRVTNRYPNPKAASPTNCEPKPQSCSTCGQLECLCRPRFFAGQVLTADDLNRLDYYIRAKHRLHNRQLHGWGVANGLEVTCDPCGKGVVVGCGYALSPCGDDIVVCEPVSVDVCALIKSCREAERLTQPCAPFQQPQPQGCDGESEWVLAIRYTETPTRGIKPLVSGHATCHQCGCSPGSCGCDSALNKKPRTAPVQCEPTIICEGFEFEVYRKPQDETNHCGRKNPRYPLAINPNSELVQRLQCCWETLMSYPKLPDREDTPAMHSWMCSFKDFLQRYLVSKSGYNCELLARLSAIVCPPGDDDSQIGNTIGLLYMVWLDALLACFCSALLPPCLPPTPDSRVPLATFKVSADQCRVLSICNWTHYRKIAITLPTLQYWFDILPFGVQLRCLLEQVCCFQITSLPQGFTLDPTHGLFAHTASEQPQEKNRVDIPPEYHERARKRLNPEVTDPEGLAGIYSLLQSALARRREDMDPKTFVESFFLSDQEKADPAHLSKAPAHLSATETANLSQFLLLNQILEPMVTSAFSPLSKGKEATSVLGTAAVGETAALKEQVAALRARLDAQDAKIADLNKRRRRE